jgi:hypothetical protein
MPIWVVCWSGAGGLTAVPVWVVCWSGAGLTGELGGPWVSRETERGVGGLLVRAGGLTAVPVWVVCWSGAGLTGELGGLLGFEGNRKGGEFLEGNGFGS